MNMRQVVRFLERTLLRRSLPAKFDDFLIQNFGAETAKQVGRDLKLIELFKGRTINGDELVSIDLVRQAVERFQNMLRDSPPLHDVDVSIVVTAHNHVINTLVCLSSLLRQASNFNFEIIIGDNASSDGTANLIANLKKPFVPLRHTENLGYLRNCNACC